MAVITALTAWLHNCCSFTRYIAKACSINSTVLEMRSCRSESIEVNKRASQGDFFFSGSLLTYYKRSDTIPHDVKYELADSDNVFLVSSISKGMKLLEASDTGPLT